MNELYLARSLPGIGNWVSKWVIVNLCAILEGDGSQQYTLLAVINLKVFTYCDNALTDWPFNKLFKGNPYIIS